MALDIAPIPLLAWLPDQPILGPHVRIAKNVIPALDGYRPFLDFGSTTRMTALTARCQGAAAFIGTGDSVPYTFAGDASKLYYNNAGTAQDVSKSGGYTVSTDDRWEFCSYGGQVVATQITDPVQAATLGTSPTFADLFTSTLKPKAKHCAVVRRQLFLGFTSESSIFYPNRVRWSAIDDITDMDASQTTQSDYQDLNNVGTVRKVIGGQYGVILCDHGIVRADYVGTPEIYTLLQVEGARGCDSSGSVAVLGQDIFYHSDEGFSRFSGGGSVPIGSEKMNRWFESNRNKSLDFLTTAAIDAAQRLYIISFASSAVTATPLPDTVLVMHLDTGKWSYASINIEELIEARSAGVTLDELDTHPLGGSSIDAMTISLDSRVFSGGVRTLGGFNSSHTLLFFDGSALTAQIDTGYFQHNGNRRTEVDKVRPQIDGGTVTVALAVKEALKDTETFGTPASVGTEGFATFDSVNSGRYVSYRFAASGNYDHIQGFEVDAQDGGVL